MGMDIVIIANFCMDFSENDNGRFSHLAQLLSKNHNVEIVTSSFYHVTKQQRDVVPNHSYKITLLNEPGYNKNISIKRFYSHFMWGLEVKKYLSKRKKPDVVFCAIPSLTAANVAVSYCKSNNVKLIVDIQDLWPEAFKIAFDIPVISEICFFPFQLLANRVYKNADTICAVSKSYLNRGLKVNKKNAEGRVVFLGTSLQTFDSNLNNAVAFKKNDNEIYIAYCGTLGKSYDLKCVIDAIKITNCNNLHLIIMGDGPQMVEYEQYAKDNNVKSDFLGRLPYDKMCATLKACDMTVNPIVGASVASIINKHADYAACGLPVLNTQNSEEYIDLINDYQMGLNSPPNDSFSLASNILILLENEEKRLQMGEQSRICAEERFNRDMTYAILVDAIIGDKK